MKKDICIISYWDSLTNYGQILQGIALQKCIKDLGFNPVTLKYNFDYGLKPNSSKREKIRKIFTGDYQTYKNIINRIIGIFFKRQLRLGDKRNFIDFKNKYLNLSDSLYNTEEDFINNYYDAPIYIVGSDQVWHATGGIERKKITLLNFVKPEAKKISYSASFGRDYIENKEERLVFKELLKKFDSISVREDSAIDICKSLDIDNVCKKPDPTFLLTKTEWINLFNIDNKPISTNKYVFIYLLTQAPKSIIKYISFFKANGYEIKYVCSDKYIDKYENIDPSIDNWIKYIYKSDIIITNSFHGTVFSLIFNKPFISIGRGSDLKKGSNSRIYTILNQMNMLENFTNNYDINIANNVIKNNYNWEKVNLELTEFKLSGLEYLSKNLKI